MICKPWCVQSLIIVIFSLASFPTYSAEVDIFSPTGEVKDVRQVSVRFSEQMVAFGDPREVNPFDINCPASGKGRWADQQNWIYDFDHNLPAGVACTFSIKPNLKTLSGHPIINTKTYSFNTGGPAILHSEPQQGWYNIDENQIFILGLDAPAENTSIQSNVHCEADGISEQIPIQIITGPLRKSILDLRQSFMTQYYYAIFKRGGNEGHSIIFGIDDKGSDNEKFLKLKESDKSPIIVLRCRRAFPNNANIRLVWGQGIKSLSGIPTSQDQSLHFHSRSEFQANFSCERVNQDAGCIPALPMNLSFTSPITRSNAEKIKLVAVKGKPIYAVIPHDAKKEEYVQNIQFPVPLEEKAQYKLVLPDLFTDDAARYLANAKSFPLEVRTDENPPLVKFAADFGILELNGSKDTPPLLPVTVRNVEDQVLGKASTPEIAGAQLRDTEHVIGWLSKLKEENNNDGAKSSIFDTDDKLNQFTLPKKLGGKEFEVVGIPLSKLGFYVVELASPKLGAALFGTPDTYYVHAAALVTNLSVHFKQGRESSLVWVTSLDKGAPVTNANVEVKDCAGKIYFNGKTDAQGILKIAQELPAVRSLPTCLTKYDPQYFVTAKLGDDFSFVLSSWNEGIATWRYNLFQGGGRYAQNTQNIAHAIMDRTLLRAGETVHMKLIVRHKNSTGFDKPSINLPETVLIRNDASDDKYEVKVSWEKNATASLEWIVPNDAKQGTYSVSFESRRDLGIAGTFQVESFRVPTMKAVLQPESKTLVNASQASLGIQVNYLAGGGASFLPVKLRGQIEQKFVNFPDYEDFTFANGSVKTGIQKNERAPWMSGGYELTEPNDAEGDGEGEVATPTPRTAANLVLETKEFKLDNAGAGKGVFEKLPKSTIPQEIHAELEYQDPNGETLTASSRIPLWPSNTVIGIKPDGWIATAEHLKFHALALDLNGKPKAGQEIVVTALQQEYFSHRRRLIGGFYAFDTHSEIKLVGDICKGVTDAKGLLICDVKAPASGNIILQASSKDEAGNTSVANRSIWVAGNNDWWFSASDNDRIDLLPEKKHYEPGDKAKLQLRMPYKEADVLVTVEREGVLSSFVTHVKRENPTIEVPIIGSYSPNVFISALAIRGRVDDAQPTALIDLGKPSFKMGLAEINVGWSAHKLNVKVATEKSVYKVKEHAKVTVDVKRADGSIPPKDSEITLVAVDEGLLELKPNDSWKLLEAMMSRRGIEVTTSTAQMQVIGKRHFGRKALPTGGDGGGGKSARELFDTLLFWKATIKLDGNGHAEASVPLNDSLTSFRIVAIANGDMDLFGTGSTSIRSTQDVMLFSGLPQLVREQDKFNAGFTIHNASERPIDVVISAKTSLGSNITDQAPIELAIPAGESRNAAWNVNVPVNITSIKWDVTAKEKGATEDGDRLKVSQKVIAAIPVRTYQATIAQMDTPQSISVKLPDGSIPGRGGINVIFRKKLGTGMAGVEEYMNYYPYTCFEQQASQAIALQDESRWNILMKKLPSYLDSNGLIKYFPMMLEGDDTLTSYILSVSNEAGYEIPEYLLKKMKRGLTGFVEGRVIRYSAIPTTDLSVRKLAAIDALSRNGEVESKWLDSIMIEPNLWPTSAVIDWYSILTRSPSISSKSAQQADEAQQIIRSRLNFQGTTMGFSTERNDALWWLMIDGDVNANKIVLAMLKEPKWQPDISRLVRGSLGRQQRGHWTTTVANAWGVLAMKEFSAKFESNPVTGTTSAVLEKQRFDQKWSDEQDSVEKLLSWPASTAPIELSHTGTGKPWMMLQSMAALPLKEPLFTGYRVARTITPISQKIAGEWHKGDVERVRLDVEAQSDMAWVVVNDPIPSGASILGTGLGGDSKLLSQGEKKEGWVWPAFEERTFDSFRAYFRFVPKGKFTVEYTVRLNNDGEFKLPTTRVEAMYAPEMFGEIPNAGVLVKP